MSWCDFKCFVVWIWLCVAFRAVCSFCIHSTYNIPFHITPCNKYISSVVSFTSALKTPTFSPLHSDYFASVREVVCHWFRACVCSGHIPHHPIPHPQLFHTTYSTSHISRHTMFHITLHHHILILHHTATSDITTHCIIFHI